MATQTQLRRGTAAQNNSFTGAVGELSYDTENKSVRVHDGSTAGGIEVLTDNGNIVINESSADVDFRVESNGNTHMLFVDGGTNQVAIGTNDLNTDSTTSLLTLGGKSHAIHLGSGSADGATGGGFFTSAQKDDKSTGWSTLGFWDNGSSRQVYYGGGNWGPEEATLHTFYTGGYDAGSGGAAERMRLTNAGDLLVGKADTAIGTAGVRFIQNGQVQATASSQEVLLLNRLTSDGELLNFRKDGTTVGSIGSVSSRLFINNGDVGLTFAGDGDQILPSNEGANRDNAIDLGHSSVRFDDIFATNGTIQTSDANEKQDIASLTSAEMLVGKRISALFKTFRWKDKVAEKGDNARTHTGIIAQDVQAAFTAESLDAGDYSLFISSTWWEHDVEVPAVEAVAEVTEDVVIAAVEEELDEEGNVVVEAQEERTEQRLITEAVEAKDAYTRTDTYDTQSEAPAGATSKTRMGIRYPELLSFVAAYNEQRFAAIETRLTALEG